MDSTFLPAPAPVDNFTMSFRYFFSMSFKAASAALRTVCR